MKHLNDYEQTLLQGWEDVHNKGQLTLWVLLALSDGAKHMSSIKEFISGMAKTLTPDDKSVYRALRRYRDSDLVEYQTVPSTSGPDLKIYSLSSTGKRVLASFLERNISGIYYQPTVRTLIEKG